MDKATQILALITPFVEEGRILLRTLDEINDNIEDFVLLYDGEVLVACAGLKDCKTKKMGEIYALAVSKNRQNQGFSEQLLVKIMQKAHQANFSKIFALSKYNVAWFLKHGFVQTHIDALPIKRQALFNHQRNPSIFSKNVN